MDSVAKQARPWWSSVEKIELFRSCRAAVARVNSRKMRIIQRSLQRGWLHGGEMKVDIANMREAGQ